MSNGRANAELAHAARAVILAGGRGSRMGRLVEQRPKPLLEVGGRSLLAHQLQRLARSQVGEVVVVVGYGADAIERQLTSWRRQPPFDGFETLEVRTARQERPLGTAHALGCASHALGDEPFFVLLGDLLLSEATLETLIARALGASCLAVVAVHHDPDPSSGAEVRWRTSDHRIVEIIEKPPSGTVQSPWNNSGIYLLPGGAARRCAELPKSPRGEYELPDLVQLLLDEGGAVHAAVIEAPQHVGTPEQLAAAEAALRGDRSPSDSTR